MAINHSEFAVHFEKKGKNVVVLPGEELPEWAKVTNPYVLGIDPDDDEDDDEPDDDEDDDEPDGPPPREGKGSGVTAWRKYAKENGVDPDGLDVDEIVGALEEAGVPVE